MGKQKLKRTIILKQIKQCNPENKNRTLYFFFKRNIQRKKILEIKNITAEMENSVEVLEDKVESQSIQAANKNIIKWVAYDQ